MNSADNHLFIQVGMKLVPIPYGTKGPKTQGWNLRKNCISNLSQIRLLDGMNIGLAHAYCEPTPTCALDIDNYKQAKQWFALHGIDLDKLIHAKNAVVIWSGKRLSLKLLYRLPVGVSPLISKKILGLNAKSAVEFRCATKDGKTVQDVLPPSMHPDGHRYEWYGEGDPLNPPVIPTEILSIWQTLLKNRRVVVGKKDLLFTNQSIRPETPREVATLKLMLCFISADCVYEKWRDVVWAILSTGWNCAEDIAYEWSKSAPDRFDEDAFWLVINSYKPDHTSPITVGTIYHHARLGGWDA
jgi:putative DNA primase/helicase